MLKKTTVDLDDYTIWCVLHAIFEAGKPLTQEEIVKWVFRVYKKRWWSWSIKKHIKRAVKRQILSEQNRENRITYYPNITYEEFLSYEEKTMNEILNRSEFLRHTTFHASPKVMTLEEYKKLKKLIDELE